MEAAERDRLASEINSSADALEWASRRYSVSEVRCLEGLAAEMRKHSDGLEAAMTELAGVPIRNFKDLKRRADVLLRYKHVTCDCDGECPTCKTLRAVAAFAERLPQVVFGVVSFRAVEAAIHPILSLAATGYTALC